MMSTNTIDGNATQLGGQVKEVAGKATGDQQTQASGVVDQISGFAQKNLGSAKDIAAQAGPLADKAKGFAKARPAATAALVGVIGLALFNTLRGRQG
jgi:uncharacterized protein YjbJ (UPF0337 family)